MVELSPTEKTVTLGDSAYGSLVVYVRNSEKSAGLALISAEGLHRPSDYLPVEPAQTVTLTLPAECRTLRAKSATPNGRITLLYGVIRRIVGGV